MNAHTVDEVSQEVISHIEPRGRAHYPPDSCTICLEPITERAITSPCNHALFDYLCVLTWLLDHGANCPLCKSEVATVSYDFASPTDFKTFHIPQKTHKSDTRRRDGLGTHSRYPDRPRSSRQHHPRRLSSPPLISDPALERRRHIYRYRLYSLHVGANPISRHQNFTPQSFAASPELQARARKWIRRELRVFDFLQPDHDGDASVARQVRNAEFLLEYIMALLKSVDVKDSNGRAEHLLGEFLGRENARLFLHETEAWLRSPWHDVKDWDELVQYQDRDRQDRQSRHKVLNMS